MGCESWADLPNNFKNQNPKSNPMKRIAFLMCIALACTSIQTYATDKNSNDKDTLAQIMASLSDLQEMVANLKDDEKTEKVGELVCINMKAKPIVTPFWGKSTRDTTKTDIQFNRFFIRWKDGFILEIIGYSDDNRQFVNQRPIALTTDDMNGDVYLVAANGDMVFLRDLIQLQRTSDHPANDGNATFKAKDDKHELKKGVGINSHLNVRLFTDGLAAFGDAPNGLAQTEMNFTHNTGSTTIRESPVIIFKTFKANATVSRFDSQFKYTDVDTNLNRTALWQRNYFDANARISLLDCWLAHGSSSSVHLDFGVGTMLTKGNMLVDSTRTDSITLISPYLMSEFGINLSIGENWDATVGCNVMWQSIPQLEGLKDNDQKFHEIGAAFKPQIMLSYTPTSSSEMFARFSYNTFQGEMKNNFFQFQLGYSISFTDLVKKNTTNNMIQGKE